MSEANGQDPLFPKPEPRLLNELLIGGTRHGQYAMIPEDKNEWFLFTEAQQRTDVLSIATDTPPPVPELYVRSDLTAEIDGEPLRRSVFRHADVPYEHALAGLTDVLLTAWIRGEVSPGG